ncbi:MAG TPA: GGDEF domain-containing protein, partial [Pseudoalteromonas sp.]|nr:GGDEF domain-containing protein [Pseudoalteromonas sp.]
NDGSIWFATAKGVSTVKPARLQASTQIALPTIIENIFVDGKPIALPLEGESVFLPPGVSRLSFHYAGLSFIMPQRLNFQTQLKGFNDKWVNRQHMTGAEYTNLPPGEYTFMVRASYPNAQWQDNQQAINIVIQSFFWQKPQFKFAVFVLFLMVIFAIYKYRLYHYKKIEIE